MMNPLPDVNHAYSLIKQDERQKQCYTPENSTTFLANSNAHNSNLVKYSGKSSGYTSNMPKNFNTSKYSGQTLRCKSVVAKITQ